MEDHAIDIIIGKGPSARSLRLDLAPFTLVGATTKTGALSAPLRDRFGIQSRLEYYTSEALLLIIERTAEILSVHIEREGALEIAQVAGEETVSKGVTIEALKALEVDEKGLENKDRHMLEVMIQKFSGGPVGLKTLAAALSEMVETIEDVYEPYLIQLGFIARTTRGRIVTRGGYEHMGIPFPQNDDRQGELL